MRGSAREEIFPIPKQGIDQREFWEAANREELVVQQCGECGERRHPPKPVCPNCRSSDVEWTELPGTGEVYTYTITHYAASPEHEDHVPYNVAVVLLDGTDVIRFVTQIIETDPGDVTIGMPVEVVWDSVNENLTVPLFQPVS